jgi:hypothetical protein
MWGKLLHIKYARYCHDGLPQKMFPILRKDNWLRYVRIGRIMSQFPKLSMKSSLCSEESRNEIENRKENDFYIFILYFSSLHSADWLTHSFIHSYLPQFHSSECGEIFFSWEVKNFSQNIMINLFLCVFSRKINITIFSTPKMIDWWDPHTHSHKSP